MKEKDRERRQEASAENVLNIIGKGTTIHGNIVAAGDMRVEGLIKGTVVCKSKLVLSSHGCIEGNVDAGQANVSGEIRGSLIARQLLHIQETGRIMGDVVTEKLIVQLGAFFSGNCLMGSVEVKEKIEQQEKIKEKTIATVDILPVGKTELPRVENGEGTWVTSEPAGYEPT
jgi:cytoskeletal protein CcmA (bactofilin family)